MSHREQEHSLGYVYIVTFKIDPEDEHLFNEIYDTEHVPNILKVPGVLGCRRVRDTNLDDNGHVTYTTIYTVSDPGLPSSSAWQEASDIGRWKDEIRPKLISRERRYSRIVLDR